MISDIGGCLTAIANVVLLRAQLGESLNDAENETFVINANQFEAIKRDLSEIERIALDLNLDATLHFANYGQEIMSRGLVGHVGELIIAKNNAERLAHCLDSIRINFLVQMNSKLVLVFGSSFADFVRSDDPPFGKSVEDAFPKVSGEISEAAKCLAFNRPTATVFHLMRAMELAVEALANGLGKSVTGKTWGVMLSDMDNAIQAMPKGETKNAWSSVRSHLYHVKQAWRNDTMHPKTTYTEEEAKAVFFAVRSFMIELVPMVEPPVTQS